MVNEIRMHITDARNLRYTIEWNYNDKRNYLLDLPTDQAYSVMYRLVDAQIGSKKATKETIIKYIKAKR